MTAPMPRCSCGCGELLTPDDLRWNFAQWTAGPNFTPPWTAAMCLTEHRKRLAKQKPVDGEKIAVKRGLAPAPRPNRGTCDKCERTRLVRRHVVGPDETLELCRRCVP